ncbi:phospho-sugar mutase [Ferrimonas futtsuensis]|uniref:phospho-sugar mutase n=1 Tax=Ferrimonas futtsuensis TaxID=364764 RepID=UPI000426BA41|nr:phospho-sugar mutase [Ferrimonas futtsuensis]
MTSEIHRWLQRDPDPSTRSELQQLLDRNDQQELEQRFSGRLAFGTAGLRGVVGAGPNRMNRLVIQETATGLAQYLLTQEVNARSRGVVIGYDGRPDSRQFAEDTAAALTAHGILVYLTVRVAPTPLVAFGVKHLNAAAGVVVTASHNPPQYNGFKVYWGNGAQIIPPHDTGIAKQIDAAAHSELSLMPLELAEENGLLTLLGNPFYEDYRQAQDRSALLSNHTTPEAISLAYTAMHGVGAEMAETLLKDAGFHQVYSVADQREPDGRFPTVNFPNPEEPGAMDLVIAEAAKHNATLAVANDPDADRLAVAARTPEGNYQMLTGDQVGVLLGHYLLSRTSASGALVGTTVVSSSLLQRIAHAAGARYYQTLTGFKWLTNMAMKHQTDECRFLFAYEEALGYTVGDLVWDKDGLSALVAFAQLTAELAGQGLTLWDRLESIYRQHGLHLNAQRSIALSPGTPPMGDALRASPPEQIGGEPITAITDLKQGTTEYRDGHQAQIDLPSSDVLIYQLASGDRVVVRPSGTEPKIKCYYEVVEAVQEKESLKQAQGRATSRMSELIASHQASLR